MSKETRLYIIAYDSPNDKRRTKIHRLLCGYGRWSQFSLFECWLNRQQLLEVQAKLDKILNKNEDSVRLYGLCAGCQSLVETIGSSAPEDPISIIL